MTLQTYPDRLPRSDLIDVVAYVDPAAGKTGSDRVKKTRARSAIIVIGQDLLTRIFTLSAWADRCSTDELVDQMLHTQSTWHPRIFGGEADGLQSLFQDMVIREAKYKDIPIPLVPKKHPTNVDKDWRIRAALQKPIREGRLFVHPSQVELYTELQGFPRAKLKDLVDALASAVDLLPVRATRRDADDQSDALAAYLREQGADPRYIVERINELQARGTGQPASDVMESTRPGVM